MRLLSASLSVWRVLDVGLCLCTLEFVELAEQALAFCAVAHLLIAVDAVLQHDNSLVRLFHVFASLLPHRVSVRRLIFSCL